MKKNGIIKWIAAVACVGLMTPSAYAILSIDDSGVAGIVEYSKESQGDGTAMTFANYLLTLGANDSDVADANGNGHDENYTTGANDYDGVLSNPNKYNGVVTDNSGWTWVMAKYDGKNGGFVLFYLPDYGNTIPEFSYPIFGREPSAGAYQMSYALRFGKVNVPDGGSTMMLLGGALAALGTVRRFFKA
jgi:hypothetical protein